MKAKTPTSPTRDELDSIYEALSLLSTQVGAHYEALSRLSTQVGAQVAVIEQLKSLEKYYDGRIAWTDRVVGVLQRRFRLLVLAIVAGSLTGPLIIRLVSSHYTSVLIGLGGLFVLAVVVGLITWVVDAD